MFHSSFESENNCDEVCNIVIEAYHWSLRMSKHIAPVAELTFGCQTRVANLTWKIHTITLMAIV